MFSPWLARSRCAVLFRCNPSAIARLVIAVVVDAVNLLAFRHFPHIGKEVVEQLPPLTDLDTPPAVVLVLLGLWVHAPTAYVGPDAIHARLAACLCMTVAQSWRLRLHLILVEAATALGSTRAQRIASDGCDSSTIATALPIRMSVACFDERHSDESAESQASHILHRWVRSRQVVHGTPSLC